MDTAVNEVGLLVLTKLVAFRLFKIVVNSIVVALLVVLHSGLRVHLTRAINLMRLIYLVLLLAIEQLSYG